MEQDCGNVTQLDKLKSTYATTKMTYPTHFSVQWPNESEYFQATDTPYHIGKYDNNTQAFHIMNGATLCCHLPKDMRDGFRILNNKILVLNSILKHIASLFPKQLINEERLATVQGNLAFALRVSMHRIDYLKRLIPLVSGAYSPAAEKQK
jgi:hypothetical protein